MTTDTFDPRHRLPGPPDPWDYAPTPSTRPSPPYHMTDMIAAEPFLADRLLARLGAPGSGAAELAAAIRAMATADDPVVVTGCGTSEHGALAAAEILREAAAVAGLRSDLIATEQAFELSLAPPRRGLVIGVSHEGATRRHQRRARSGARSGSPDGRHHRQPPLTDGELAEIVVETDELDQGWCHTVGYLSPILAASAIGAHLSGRALDQAVASDLVRPGRATRPAPRRSQPRSPTRPTCSSSPRARSPGRSRTRPEGRGGLVAPVVLPRPRDVPARPPAGDGAATGLVLVLTDRDRRPERLVRARQALAAAARHRPSRRRHRLGRGGGRARRGAHAGRPSHRPRGGEPSLPGRGARRPRHRSSSSPSASPARAARTPTSSAATTRSTSPRPRPRRCRLATAVAVDLDLPDEDLAHDVDHVEVPGQEVLEHDPLDPAQPRTGGPSPAPRPVSR